MFIIFYKERLEVFEVLSKIDNKHRYYVIFSKKSPEQVIDKDKDYLKIINIEFEVFVTTILVDGNYNDYINFEREHKYGLKI